MAINKITTDKIAAQALNEIAYARTHKQGKVGNWQLNEQLYYSKKPKSTESRANINLGRMQEFVHTLLSKIDNPLIFKFTKRKNSQLKRVQHLNALVDRDRHIDNWDIKDIVGKKQGILYGRAIYSYFADSINKVYKPHLENIDVYDFLIDPAAGGIDIEKAFYMGDFTISLKASELKAGAKRGEYIKDTVKMLLEGSGNATEQSTEETNKLNRTYKQNTWGKKEIGDITKYKFWRWFTTWEDGERYYLVIDNAGNYIKCEPLKDAFPETEEFPLGAYPYWTWAAFMDMTEFWTPSYADYAREIFMAQDVSIGQMIDNAEAINKPQRVVNTNALENLAELKYRRDGVIRVKNDVDINRVYQRIDTPSINTPIEVYNLLEQIVQKALGITAAEAGVEDTDGRVAIYEGNQQATSDRFGLLNKSYAFGYKRFAKLYELGVRNHLLKKTAIDILGPDGAEVKEIKRSDIFKKNDDYSVQVEASNAEYLTSAKEKDVKLKFLTGEAMNQGINQKKNFEMRAKIAGISPEEISELQDTSFYGNSELMSECDRDLEMLIENEEIKVNQAANNAYKQKMVNYLKDHHDDLNTEQYKRIADYIVSLEEVIMSNEARQFQDEMTKMQDEGTMMPPIDGEMSGGQEGMTTPANSRNQEILPPTDELKQLMK